MPVWLLALFPSLIKSAVSAVIEKKPVLEEIKKSVGISIKPANNKKTVIVTLIASLIALLGSYGVSVSAELQSFIVAALYAYAVLFAVSKKPEE